MSLMMVRSPSTSEAVDFTSMAVSSRPFTLGMGASRSPSTRSFIRLAHAFMGLLILPARTRATITEISVETIITPMLIAIPI